MVKNIHVSKNVFKAKLRITSTKEGENAKLLQWQWKNAVQKHPTFN